MFDGGSHFFSMKILNLFFFHFSVTKYLALLCFNYTCVEISPYNDNFILGTLAFAYC